MLAGRQLFQGETVSDILAAVIRADPEWQALPASVPGRIRQLLVRCLERDPKRRLQAIGEARILIEQTLSGTTDLGADRARPSGELVGRTPRAPAGSWRRALPWGTATAIALATTIFFATHYLRLASAPSRTIISQILPPASANYIVDSVITVNPELSPDGTRIVYLASEAGGMPRFWIRSLDSLNARPLEGTEGATAPFWSPDGHDIGFFLGGKLRKMSASGGPPVDLAPAPIGRGGSWSADGTILFAPGINTPIQRVSTGGGRPTTVTSFNTSRQESSHRWPQFLPDDQHFLYYAVSASRDDSGTYIGSLGGGEPKLLIRGDSNAIYAPPGYILFARGATLMAQRLDLDRLELTGDPVVISENVTVLQPAWRTIVAVSQDGMLAYWTGSSRGGRRMVWYDRKGKAGEALGSSDVFQDPRISPSGRQLAVTVGSLGGNADLWVYDLARETKTRLTFAPTVERSPVWSPDGTDIVFASNRQMKLHLYEKAADGTGTTHPLLVDGAAEIPDSWSTDGRYIAYERQDIPSRMDSDIWILPLFGDKKPFPFLQSSFNETHAAFAPDGKWLAYTSDESGTNSVYIVPFPKGNGKWQVSTNGGREAHWRRDGKELFYISADQKLMSVDIHENGPSLVIGNPQPLMQLNPAVVPGTTYDASGDGSKFIVLSLTQEVTAEPITLVTNWTALLQK
jgi:eukaryotic-like serine/threonine-protein kinase